jgi:hypothetical protein
VGDAAVKDEASQSSSYLNGVLEAFDLFLASGSGFRFEDGNVLFRNWSRKNSERL